MCVRKHTIHVTHFLAPGRDDRGLDSHFFTDCLKQPIIKLSIFSVGWIRRPALKRKVHF
jgi:hypothetical protein